MRSDEAFGVANEEATPLTGAGGVVLAPGGLGAAFVPESAAGIALFGGVLFFLALCIAGAVKGIRACR